MIQCLTVTKAYLYGLNGAYTEITINSDTSYYMSICALKLCHVMRNVTAPRYIEWAQG
jgi:hypothetical protein